MTFFRVLEKFRQILSHHQKVRIVELGILMIIAGFMEVLSVTLIVPFIEAIMNPEKVMNNRYVMIITGLLGIESYRTFLVLLALVMAMLYIIKNAFLLFRMTIQNRFVYNNMFATQQKLLRNYLQRPYEYFLGIKSGEVLRIIGSDTTGAFSILTEIMSLISEMVVSFSLMFTVLVLAPVFTLVMGGLLILTTVLIQWRIRPVMRTTGEISIRSAAGMNQWLLQSIQGIKEVKLMRREGYFENRFEREGKNYIGVQYKRMTLATTPRYMIEAVAMGLFFSIMAFMIYRGTELELLLPMLSGVAMAAVRLLPAANRISSAMASITFGEPAVDKMLENLKNVASYESENNNPVEEDNKPNKASIGELSDAIHLSDITYRYPTGTSNILEHAQMEIGKGLSVGIVGTSGAGKTTAIDVLLGLLRPQNGSVLVDGTDIRLDMDGWLDNIGYIPQSIFMLDGTIRENVAFGRTEEETDDNKVWKALREAALDAFVRSLPEGLDTQIGERGVRLSGGQKQRIGIARALYTDPAVLVFDEATSALDNETEKAIMESIDHLHGSKTMIIIAHRLTTIENCDVVYRVENGKIERVR